MPIETRSNNALFRRAEQLRRWEDSETNKVSVEISPSKKSKIKFSDGCVFLAACAAGDIEEVERLLQQSADINTANVDGLTALHQACIDDNLDMVQFLVEHGCNINQGDNEGWTPLHATASCGFISIAHYLIENGANVAAVNNDGDLPIDIAESPKMEELLSDVLDDQGINCDEARSEEEKVMLEDANQWLNSQKCQDQIHTRTGASALHVAAAKGYVNVMNVLIKAGADLNAQDNDGWTPLHAAAHWAQKEACAILADNLANMDIQNFSGQTCFDVAEPDLVKLLEELKKKQASMQKEKPEIQAILQRTSIRPPLKRRTSVTRMSGQEKSKSVMKDTKSERAQIEQLSLPEEDDEDKKQQEIRELEMRREMKRIMDESFLHRKPEPRQPVSEADKQPEKIPSWKKALRRSSDNLDEENKPKEEPEVVLKKPKSTDPDEKPLKTKSPNGPSKEMDKQESTTEKNKFPDSSNHSTLEAPESMVTSIPSSPSDASSDSMSQGKRSFIPPVRDEESELQRKAHAKRVRETRRSTQGVLLEDVRSAEFQYIVKATQKARESQNDDDDNDDVEEEGQKEGDDENKRECAKKLRPEKLDTNVQISDVNKSSNPNSPDSSPSVTLLLRTKSTTNSDELSSPDSRTTLGTPAAIQRRRRPKRRSTGVVYLDSDDALEDKESSEKCKSSNKEKTHELKEGTSDRVRHRFGSYSYPDSEASSRSETPSRQSSCSRSNDEADKDYKKLYEDMSKENERLEDVEKENEQLKDSLKSTEEELKKTKKIVETFSEANNSPNSLSKTEKRFSDGTKDSGRITELEKEKEDLINTLKSTEEELKSTKKIVKSLNEANSSRSSSSKTETKLNIDVNKSIERLAELEKENEELKKSLKSTEDELERTKRTVKQLTEANNSRNSVNEADRRERRALERRISELEEEARQFETLQTENERLKDENGALIRVISKLSK